ncbi:MAG: hypothetical protein ACRDTC_22395 [Pseudonocardiaceae bacterium]
MGTNFNYDDADHQVIYDNINGGVGSQPLQEVSQAWKQLAQDVGDTAKTYVEKALRGILASREGTAAQFAPSSGGQAGPGAPGSGGGIANPTPGQGVTPAPVPFGAGSRNGAPPRGGPEARGGARPGSGTLHHPSMGASRGGGAGSGLRPGVGAAGFGPQPGMGGPPGAEGARGTAAAVRGTSAGAGAGGMGAPFGGAGGQGGGKDREHRRRYLIQSDPHEIVGELPATAPPVIGADIDD